MIGTAASLLNRIAVAIGHSSYSASVTRQLLS
jgi:hypothetical protein